SRSARPLPLRPMPCVVRPFPSRIQVVPPSVLLKIPPPGPLVGAYVYQGGRRVFQRHADTRLAFVGSITTSTAPTSLFLNRTLRHDFPPSTDLKTPRSALGA